MLPALGEDPLAHIRLRSSEGDEAAWDKLDRLARAMARHGRARDAPVREMFAMFGDRWTMLILLVLRTGTWRHATLRRIVESLSAEGALSQRVLTQKLRAMERNGLVAREATPDVPPKVYYSLSRLGVDVVARVGDLLEWLETHLAEVEKARAAFTAREDC